jgi:hypothetical protein
VPCPAGRRSARASVCPPRRWGERQDRERRRDRDQPAQHEREWAVQEALHHDLTGVSADARGGRPGSQRLPARAARATTPSAPSRRLTFASDGARRLHAAPRRRPTSRSSPPTAARSTAANPLPSVNAGRAAASTVRRRGVTCRAEPPARRAPPRPPRSGRARNVRSSAARRTAAATRSTHTRPRTSPRSPPPSPPLRRPRQGRL